MSNSKNTPRSKKNLHDLHRSAASNLLLMDDIDREQPAGDGDNRGELLARQEWCGAYAGVTELYELGQQFIVHTADGQHTYTDAQEALKRSGIAVETDATVSIWIDPLLE